MHKLTELLKIGGTLLFSYLLVSIISPRFFINNTPQVDVQYIASLRDGVREAPSKAKVFMASLFTPKNSAKQVEIQIEEFKKETGATEVAFSPVEETKLAETVMQTTNPVPNAVFNYMSKGVAASEPDTQGNVVIRFEGETKIREFTLKDGRIVRIMSDL